MPIHAIARLIQTMLYARRFFPFYVYNILGGIEEDGEFLFFYFHKLKKKGHDTPCPLSCGMISHQTTCSFHSLTGTGAVYSFDPVGSYEREACRAAGAAQSLVQPFLDNQVS